MTTTNPEVLVDLLDAVGNRLNDIAKDINDRPNDPALAEVRAARAAAERAEVLLGKWGPSSVAFSHTHDEEDICQAILSTVAVVYGDRRKYLAGAKIESCHYCPSDWVRVTMPKCVWLLRAEWGPAVDGCRDMRATYYVVGRYPQ